MSGHELKPGDVCSYTVPLVRVVSRQFHMVEIEFQDGARLFVDECYLSRAHQVADDYEWKTHPRKEQA